MVTLQLQEGRLLLRTDYQRKELAKSITGRAWSKRHQGWLCPVRPEIVTEIKALFPEVRVPGDIASACQVIADREAEVKAAKLQGWEDIEVTEPMPVKCKPYKHQQLAYEICCKLITVYDGNKNGGGAALLAEQGTGKSMASLAVAGRAFLNGKVKRLLIVCPSSVVPVWKSEFNLYADFPYEINVATGPVAKRVKVLDEWERNPNVLQVSVWNYEGFWRAYDSIVKWGPDMAIVDESQRLAHPNTNQSKYMHKLTKIVPYRLILTGTPVTNNPLTIFSQYKFLDPSIFGNSFTAFKAKYAVMGGYQNYQVVGYKNLEELVQKTHSIAFRVTKAECLDLPDTVDQVLYCDLEPGALKKYKEMQRHSVMELENEDKIIAQNVLSRLLRLSQVTGGFVEHEQVSKAKLGLLKETLEDLMEAGHKVVLFARFLDEIEAIRELLVTLKVGFECMTGATPIKDRGDMVQRFQTDDNCRVFLAQIKTGREGITLHSADTMIFYSLDYSYADYEQAKARIHRSGQTKKCTYIHLIAKDTVDEKVMEVLKVKGNIAKMVVDDWKSWLS